MSRVREDLFEGLEGIDEFGAGFAVLAFKQHPEWHSFARISAEWPVPRGGALEIDIPNPAGEGAEPLRIFVHGDECLITYGPGHDHVYLSFHSGDEKLTFSHAIAIAEKVLTERRIVVSIDENGRGSFGTQYEGAPDDVPEWLEHHIGKQYKIWSWLGTYTRMGVAGE